ncbi:MAG: LacI family transcriptional regulator [Chloroflexi bacterium]|nr:LacI family transcriptional regulator [Chloroflexota bacterium]
MSVTRNDVAALAGVSVATVSYVVNNGPRPVSAETRERVLRAIEQLDYQPSAVARSLKTNRTQTVGIVVSDILNPILAAIAKHAEDLLLPSGHSLILGNSDESPEHELQLLRTLVGRRADGVLLLPTGHNQRTLYSAMEKGCHLGLLDRQVEGVNADCVMFDNEGGAYEAVQHLIESGHTRIGLLNLPAILAPGRGRLSGYRRALKDAGLTEDPRLVREVSFKAQECYAMAGELLDVDPPPTALFAASNRLAEGVLRHVKERRLRMPDDIALCVFDDVAAFSYMTPSITAVGYDTREFASRAVGFLCDRIEDRYDGDARIAQVSCRLIRRESTIGSTPDIA